ncbi:MAG: hypothetical protein JW794_01320 [Candidatus Cloacimonetes bacterium]|nr:hypothetical protein [Candidatus Cloacimonadota bacterium]
MNILIANFDHEKTRELNEYFSSHRHMVYSVDNDLEAVQVLNNTKVEQVLININKILNFGLINYINNHYSDIVIVIVTNNCVEQAISIIKNCTYDIIHEPLTLSALRQKLLV